MTIRKHGFTHCLHCLFNIIMCSWIKYDTFRLMYYVNVKIIPFIERKSVSKYATVKRISHQITLLNSQQKEQYNCSTPTFTHKSNNSHNRACILPIGCISFLYEKKEINKIRISSRMKNFSRNFIESYVIN